MYIIGTKFNGFWLELARSDITVMRHAVEQICSCPLVMVDIIIWSLIVEEGD